MLRESEVLSLLMRRTPAHSLEQDLYCDPGVFEVDMEKIWYREWVFTIPACEIPKSGEYVVHELGAYSVVIVRGNDGQIRAFHNACRHRGSVLCKTKKGRGPKLVCPYHQWTYELDGSLLWARDMGPDFDASKHGLKTVHCRTVSGMVYICLADDAPDFEAFAAETARYLAPHDLENSKVAFESTIIEKGNWKLVWKTTASAITAPETTLRCAAPSPTIRGPSATTTPARFQGCWLSTFRAAKRSVRPRPTRKTLTGATGASFARRCSGQGKATRSTARSR